MIKLYFANGTEVSGKGVFTHAIKFTLQSDTEQEGTAIRLYAEATNGYEVSDAEVKPISANGAATTNKWALASDNYGSVGVWEDYGDPLELGTVGNGAGKKYFWIKAKATEDEGVKNDDSVLIEVSGTAEAVDD